MIPVTPLSPYALTATVLAPLPLTEQYQHPGRLFTADRRTLFEYAVLRCGLAQMARTSCQSGNAPIFTVLPIMKDLHGNTGPIYAGGTKMPTSSPTTTTASPSTTTTSSPTVMPSVSSETEVPSLASNCVGLNVLWAILLFSSHNLIDMGR